jgi:hypothetical protein
MSGRLFTVEEANALLPALVRLMERIFAARDELVAIGDELERVLARSSGNGGSKGASKAAAEMGVITEIVAEIRGLGCELKDLDQGLVDFPARHPEGEGRVVYLCWRYGEDKIEWWHETDAGFAGRQRL